MFVDTATDAWSVAQALSAVATGDDANILLYAIIGILAVAVVVVLTFKDKLFKPKGEKPTDETDKKNK